MIFATPAIFGGGRSVAGGGGGGSGTVTKVLEADWLVSGAGRIGFYQDYAERTSHGTLSFYVWRTHGSTGDAEVTITTSGDGHSTISETVTFTGGKFQVWRVDVEITEANITSHAGNGEFRIKALASNPTGGATLHFGSTHTYAVGIIDDSINDDGTVNASATMIADDDNAVFYDSAAAGGGNGTSATPYNNIYTALSNLGSKRYLYGTGTTTVDTTQEAVGMDGTPYCLPAPANRTATTQAIVRAWPGKSWTIQGTGTNKLGFYADGGQSWHVYRGITFTNLDNSGQAEGAAVFYRYGSSSGILVEHCAASNINGASGANNGAYMYWGVDGFKAWRSTGTNIQTAGSATNQNTAPFFTYDGTNCSIQRCEGSTANNFLYHKRVATAGDVGTRVAFCHATTSHGAYYGASGSSGAGHSYAMLHNNLFEGCNLGAIWHIPGNPPSALGTQTFWIFGGVFDACGSGEDAAITGRYWRGVSIVNPIMIDCRKVWADYQDTSGSGGGDEVTYANYILESGTTLTSQRYEYRGVNYTTASALNTAHGFAANDNEADPLFTDAASDDYTLGVGSPGLTGGIGGSEQGLYPLGIEVIAA